MATKVEIANRALQFLGAKRIASLTEDSRNARAINAAFEPAKLSELRKHPWNFSIKRAQLAADVSAPLFGRARSFQLPSDCLMLLSPDPELNFNTIDWQVEGRKIITNDSDPLDIRYVCNIDDPNIMDPLFREALAARLARDLCEEITQSNQKKSDTQAIYEQILKDAKKANAIERKAVKPPEDTWVTIRN